MKGFRNYVKEFNFLLRFFWSVLSRGDKIRFELEKVDCIFVVMWLNRLVGSGRLEVESFIKSWFEFRGLK